MIARAMLPAQVGVSTTVEWAVGNQTISVQIPTNVLTFISVFDQGCYPELVC